LIIETTDYFYTSFTIFSEFQSNEYESKKTQIYFGLLKIELHPVLSHTKMDFTILKESFTQDCSRTTLEPYKNYKHTLKNTIPAKLMLQETIS